MGIPAVIATSGVFALGLCASPTAAAVSAGDTSSPKALATRQAASPVADGPCTDLTGSASLDSSVTGSGALAKRPPGTRIDFQGFKITGIDGYSTTPYKTDALLVAVIDCTRRPTADQPESEPGLDIDKASASSPGAETCYSYESATLNRNVDDHGRYVKPGRADLGGLNSRRPQNAIAPVVIQSVTGTT
jgi:hypothetical protein